MSQTIKTIRSIDTETINLIDARASELNVTSNELIREVLKDYAKSIQEVESSVVLHAYIDDLIEANNRLIQAQNQNTLVIGELAKKIIERLDFYLPKMEIPEE